MQRRMKVIDQLYNRTVGILHQASWKLDWLESEVERLQKNESETLARGCRNVRAHSRLLHASQILLPTTMHVAWLRARPVNLPCVEPLGRARAESARARHACTRASKSTLDSLDSETGSPPEFFMQETIAGNSFFFLLYPGEHSCCCTIV